MDRRTHPTLERDPLADTQRMQALAGIAIAAPLATEVEITPLLYTTHPLGIWTDEPLCVPGGA